jgi:hypothetical protein
MLSSLPTLFTSADIILITSLLFATFLHLEWSLYTISVGYRRITFLLNIFSDTGPTERGKLLCAWTLIK